MAQTKTLVLYFSATGTTRKAAQKVARQLGADIAAIHPQQPYTSADLDWNNSSSRATSEQRTSGTVVPIKKDLPDPSPYGLILIGTPIWWGDPPKLLRSVIDALNLNGKKVAGFATSGGSDYSGGQQEIEQTVREDGYSAAVLPGAILNSDGAITSWVKSLQKSLS